MWSKPACLSRRYFAIEYKSVLRVFLLSAQRRLLSELQPNTESVGELWLGLLRFYTEEFDFKEHVISIRQRKRLTTFEKQWTSKCIAIEGAHTAPLPGFDLNKSAFLSYSKTIMLGDCLSFLDR